MPPPPDEPERRSPVWSSRRDPTPRPVLGDAGPGVPLPRLVPVVVVLGVIVALGVLGLLLGVLARFT